MSDGNLYILDVSKVKSGVPHHVRRAQPGGVCYYNNYYTIPDDQRNHQFKLDGLDPFYVESTVLPSLENRYTKVIYPKLISKEEFSAQNAADLCDFIIQLKFRNPFHFETMQNKMPEILNEVFDDLSKKVLQPGQRFSHLPIPLREAVLEWVKQDAIGNSLFSKQMQLSRFVEEHNDPERRQVFRNALLKAKWSLLESPAEGPFFITSDNPGFAVGRDGLNYNTKFQNGFAFYFPVSAKRCLAITDVYGSAGNFKLSKVSVHAGSVIGINDRAIQQVNKLLIASERNYLDQILEINRKNKISK